MPEITAFLVNETLHQGLVFIYVSSPAKCFTEPLTLKSKQLAGLLTKLANARSSQTPSYPWMLSDTGCKIPHHGELSGKSFLYLLPCAGAKKCARCLW